MHQPIDNGGGGGFSSGGGGFSGGGGSFDVKRLLVDVQPARLTTSIAMNNRVTSVSPLA